jgi:peptidoglycan hydrolase FlgJ
MTVAITPGLLETSPTRKGATEPERLKAAAQQFEAIFVRQMLSAARSADFGGDDLFGSQGEETFREMRDAQFAQVVSEAGSLGLASSIEAQLARHLAAKG